MRNKNKHKKYRNMKKKNTNTTTIRENAKKSFRVDTYRIKRDSILKVEISEKKLLKKKNLKLCLIIKISLRTYYRICTIKRYIMTKKNLKKKVILTYINKKSSEVQSNFFFMFLIKVNKYFT